MITATRLAQLVSWVNGGTTINPRTMQIYMDSGSTIKFWLYDGETNVGLWLNEEEIMDLETVKEKWKTQYVIEKNRAVAYQSLLDVKIEGSV